jgi:ketopantoate hydroxymethyltransferase
LSVGAPSFAKPYADLAQAATAAIRHYAADVAAGRDPADGPS